MDTVYEQIYRTVATIPKGRVASYGQVAKATGLFRGARIVGWALRVLPYGGNVPWHRVVRQDGSISILHPRLTKDNQKDLLEKEGLVINKEKEWYRVENPPWHNF